MNVLNGEDVDVIAIWLDNFLQQAKFCSQDHRQLRACIQVVWAIVFIIQLFDRAKVDVVTSHAVDFRRLENDTWSRRVRHLRGLAHDRIEEIESVELAEPVDSEVAVEAVRIETEGVCVDTSRGDELRCSQSVKRTSDKCMERGEFLQGQDDQASSKYLQRLA